VRFEDLSPRQAEAVEATEPFVLVTSGAGSGKTTVALWAARRHLERDGARPAERVLFVTFSRTAVGQIDARGGAVLKDLGDRVEVQTFHSLAYRLLKAFGRYAGRGSGEIQVESMARSRLLGSQPDKLSYDDLLPGALELLESVVVSELATRRWSLIICDEFQDTTDDQWRLLKQLQEDGRLLVLADPHQMIYQYVPTVSQGRLTEAEAQADKTVALEEASHRDPTGVIPAMAAAVRRRDFGHPSVATAIEAGRLTICRCSDPDTPDAVDAEIGGHRSQRRRSVGVLETTNAAVASLGAELTDRGVDYTLVGLPEAHGEALLTMAGLVAVGLGAMEWSEAQTQLGVFLTSVTRASAAPELARQFAGTSTGMREFMRERLEGLQDALRLASHDDDELIAVAIQAWPALGITAGNAAWKRAVPGFAALARRELGGGGSDAERAETLIAACRDLQLECNLTTDVAASGPIQLMNFHQTKGREADAVVLVYRENGYVTRGRSEPFEDDSRVLYVALSRAREAVTILVPPDPHPFIGPLAKLAD
jgi:DNA helicase-2/ATP-dependent DNA helicase PcrA